jgi:hypothetical protein
MTATKEIDASKIVCRANFMIRIYRLVCLFFKVNHEKIFISNLFVRGPCIGLMAACTSSDALTQKECHLLLR